LQNENENENEKGFERKSGVQTLEKFIKQKQKNTSRLNNIYVSRYCIWGT
jgi:hypothetical protein